VLPITDLDAKPTSNTLILGQVVGVQIDPAFLNNDLFDIVAAGTIARCGYRGHYAEVTRVFETFRPFSEMSGFKSLRKR
jgi:flavin reductase (DIM6/NTAB) family NADH-FMN oxidoreductase RutF